MKKYKKTRMIVSVALLSSLALANVAFAADETTDFLDRTPAGVTQEATHSSSSTALFGTGKLGYPKTLKVADRTKGAKNKAKHKLNKATGTSTRPFFFGKVTAVSGTGFTIKKRTSTLTVKTTDGTVYMKDGNLDSSADIVVGATAMVKGTFDKTSETVTASGIDILTRHLNLKK
jgi:Domain of unknown function (DUF5666)